MNAPNLDDLAKLEAAAAAAWHEVHHPSPGRGQSINESTNKERAFLAAHRADQAIAGWYLDHAEAIKAALATLPRRPFDELADQIVRQVFIAHAAPLCGLPPTQFVARERVIQDAKGQIMQLLRQPPAP